MDYAIHECAQDASWRLRWLLRSRRFFTDAEMVFHFKAHLLSFIEYRTPAIYHATCTALAPLDGILFNFLRQLGISEDGALHHFRPARLRSRRDIAMLCFVHRSVLGLGPPHFKRFFRSELHSSSYLSRRRHNRHLVDIRPIYRLEMYSRSALSLPWVYNLLPQWIVDSPTVTKFQSNLQLLMRRTALSDSRWPDLFSPRLPFTGHPLRG